MIDILQNYYFNILLIDKIKYEKKNIIIFFFVQSDDAYIDKLKYNDINQDINFVLSL